MSLMFDGFVSSLPIARQIVGVGIDWAKFIVPLAALAKVEGFGRELFQHGIWRLPYRRCYFQLTQPATGPLGHSIHRGLFAMHLGDEGPDLKLALTDVFLDGGGYGHGTTLWFHRDSLSGGWELSNRASSEGERSYDAFVSRCLVSSIALLSTKGITLDRTEVSPKLNAKREADGKKRLHSYATIRIDPEHITQRGHLGGSHASPAPHWRRGHVRKLSSGALAIVRPCVVNAEINPSPPAPQYVVEAAIN